MMRISATRSLTPHVVVVVTVAGIAGCVPIHRRTIHSDQVLARADVQGKVASIEWSGSVRPLDTGFEVRVKGEQRCSPEVEQRLMRRTQEEKTADRLALTTSIVAGVVFGALGGVLLYDNRGGAAPDDALLYASEDPAIGRNTGIAIVGVGTLSLASAVIAGFRARDEAGDAKPITVRSPRDGSPVACGDASPTGVRIALISDTSEFQAGTPDQSGVLAVPFGALPDDLVFDGDTTSAVSVRATTPERTLELGQVSLATARQTRLAARWQKAETANDPAMLEALAALDRERAEAGLQRARGLRVERATKAIAARDAVAAGAELDALAKHHRAGPDLDALRRDLEVLRETLAVEERERARERAVKAVEDAVAAVQLAGASAEAFRTATALLEQTRADHPSEARLVSLGDALAKARKRRTTELLAETRTQLGAERFAEARRALAEAGAVDPADTRVARSARGIDDAELRALERQARKAISAGRLDEATTTVDRGLAIREDDARMLRLVGMIRAAAQSARKREDAEQRRAHEATFAAHLASARKLSRAGDFTAARRAVADARALDGNDPRVARAAKQVDEAELRSIVNGANQALAKKQIDEAMGLVERGIELSPDDARLVRLINRIRAATKRTRPAK